MSLGDPRCFTDSQVTLFWIKGIEKDWRPFVQNRVEEIRKLTPVDIWSHCPGKENPADLPSRGLTPVELTISQLWKYETPELSYYPVHFVSHYIYGHQSRPQIICHVYTYIYAHACAAPSN